MRAQMTILRDIIYSASTHGADFKKVCEELGFEPDELNNSGVMAPYEKAAPLWSVVIKHTKDPLLGLHLGEELSPTILGMIGYLMQSSKNLYESFHIVIKYWELFSSMSKLSMEQQEGHVLISDESIIVWQHQYPEDARQAVEFALSGVIKLFKMLSGRKVLPVRVEFAYPPRSVHEYERIFQTPIHFNGTCNTLTFRKSDLLIPILSYDKSLFEFFNNTLGQKLKSLQGNELFSDKIKQLIINDFKGQTPSIEIASAKLNMTPRSLQRKLKEDNTSYRTIITDLKKELAQTIMGQSDFRVGEVAELLGYADSSSFRKAYKKWRLV
jgi:AraC-like DNA-binding protein